MQHLAFDLCTIKNVTHVNAKYTKYMLKFNYSKCTFFVLFFTIINYSYILFALTNFNAEVCDSCCCLIGPTIQAIISSLS